MRVLVLSFRHPVEGLVESRFTLNERVTALAIANAYLAKGWKPLLVSKTYDGNFKVLLNWNSAGRKRKAA